MESLQGHVALVTGASQGIGRACAVTLAKAGATVALAARNEEKLKAAVAQIEAEGGKAVAFPLDVASEDAIKSTVKADLRPTRKNRHSRQQRRDYPGQPAAADEARRLGRCAGHQPERALLLTQAVLSGMLKQRWGRIINITSIVGEMGAPGQVNYASSKAGLIGLTLSVAREVASRNITVNAVAPGYIATAMTEALTDEQKQAITAQIPLGRQGSDPDIANAVLFLASNEAGYITGHVLDVNGGMLMR